MANHIEFRLVQTKAPNGQVCGERWQYRTKEITAAILGVIPIASTWSEWTNVNVVIEVEQT